MQPSLISQLASAVSDEDEWAIICQGERRERGYVIEVTGYKLPPQKRSSGHVDIAEIDLEPEDALVIHSHHTMGAFFSQTDEKELNPRFPASIVVAQAKSAYLGFDYRGTGKVTLPCGSVGEVDFYIQPTTGPELHAVSEVTHNATDLGKCTRYTNVSDSEFHVEYKASCGLSEPRVLRANAFGSDDSLLKVVAELERPQLTLQEWHKSENVSLRNNWCPKHQIRDNCNFYFCTQHQEYDGCSKKTSAKNPTKKDRSWLDSIVPDRFRPKQETPLLTKESDELEDYGAYCEVCGNMNWFAQDECETCGAISEYCQECDRGHDVRSGCPQEIIVLS